MKNCNIEEGQETKCIFCGGYAQFFHNRYSYSCFDCGQHWQPNETNEVCTKEPELSNDEWNWVHKKPCVYCEEKENKEK